MVVADSARTNEHRGWGGTLVWATLATVILAWLPGYFRPQPVPLPILILLAGFALAALWRPFNALLLLAAFCPVAGVVHGVSHAPYDAGALLEAVLLVITGMTAVRAAIRRVPAALTAFDFAVFGFIAVVAASTLAHFPMIALRSGTADWTEAFGQMMRQYFFRHPPFTVVQQSALLIEGALLAALVARVAHTSGRAARLSNMIVLGGAAAAALNGYRLLEVALRRPPAWPSLLEALQSLRFNTQYSDLNAAGSYFAMVTVLAAGLAGWRTGTGRLHAAALPLLGVGLWVSGSRVALAAALLGILIVVVRFAGRSRPPHAVPAIPHPASRTRSRSSVYYAGWGGALLCGLGLLVFALPVTRHSSFQYAVSTRIELLRVGGRMVADRPLLGVGPAQYYALFPRYASADLQRNFEESTGYPVPRENAHNQFVQVLAELGIAGLGFFVAVLFLMFRVDRVTPGSTEHAVRAALLVFLATCLAGHPLLTSIVAISFWLLVGLAASKTRDLAAGPHRVLGAIAAGTAVLLVISLPWRWSLERREADLAGVSLGLSAWQRDVEGMRYQWARGEASVFVASASPLVRIPLRSPDQAKRQVRILLDGELAGMAYAVPDRWTEARLPLPQRKGAPAYRRIDLVVEPQSPGHGPAGETVMVGRVIELER